MNRSVVAHANRAAQLPPVHPGEVLLTELSDLGVTPHRFALATSLPLDQVQAVLTGRGAMDLEMAMATAAFTGTSAALWLRMQARFDEVC